MSFNLTTNSLLSEIVQNMGTQKPDWEAIRGSMGRYHGKLGRLIGAAAETHTRWYLETLASSYDGRITLDAINEPRLTDNFKFGNRGGRIVSSRSGKIYTEYDSIALVDGLPVVFEVRMTGLDLLISIASTQEVCRKIKPLEEYFERNEFGYVVIGYPRLIGNETLITQKHEGVILVPFSENDENCRRGLARKKKNPKIP